MFLTSNLFKTKEVIINFIYKWYYDLNKHDHIFTHMTNNELLLLHRCILKRRTKIKCAVEIGSYLGASSCYISAALNKNAKLYCIDTWGNHAMHYDEKDTDSKERDSFDEFKSNTVCFFNKIIMLRGWSSEMIYSLKTKETKIDFLFIDGDHHYESVKKDWDLYSPLLGNGSIVAFHDTGWAEGVNRVISENILMLNNELHHLPNIKIFLINN